jgi:predicted GNAT superfamily acetyltransferase
VIKQGIVSGDFTIRPLTTLDECRDVVALEKRVWGYTDAEDVVPVPVLIVTVKRGGILLGAFDRSGRMVGFVYSLPALKDGRASQWSHMLGVLPESRDAGLGARLKLEQRRAALGMGLDLVEWTYDPMQAMNAHLNFAKLGVIVSEYEENIYGDSSSPLHRGSPTDRFVAEWWLSSHRVEQRIARTGRGQPEMADRLAIVNQCVRRGSMLDCGDVDLHLTDKRVAVEIPMGFTDLQQSDPSCALAWRMATREIFTTYFHRGYRAVDFLLDKTAGRGRYILEMKSGGVNA